MVILMAL